jgi:hypothetical protein
MYSGQFITIVTANLTDLALPLPLSLLFICAIDYSLTAFIFPEQP